MDVESQVGTPEAKAQVAKWNRLLHDAPKAALRRIAAMFDLEQPPGIAPTLLAAFEQAQPYESESLPAILLAHDLAQRALADPTLLHLDQAVQITRLVLAADSHFDSKLLRMATDEAAKPYQVYRILAILNRIRASKVYVATPALRLLGHSDPTIRGEAARIYGRATTNFQTLQATIEGQPSQVISSLLLGFIERPDFNSPEIKGILVDVAQKPDPRIAATAVALLWYLGETASKERLDEMLQSEDVRVRASAHRAVEAVNAATEVTAQLGKLAEALTAESHSE